MSDKTRLLFALILVALLVSYVVICTRLIIAQPTRELCAVFRKLPDER